MTDSQLLKETAKFLEQIASRGGPLSGNAMEHARRLHELCAVSETAATDRNAIIEECARTAENTPTVLEPTGTFFSERCAKAIRSLKTAGASAPSATAAPAGETPTPRTDAFYRQHPICEYEQAAHPADCEAWLDFARKLERELADKHNEATDAWNDARVLRIQRDAASLQVVELTGRIAELEAARSAIAPTKCDDCARLVVVVGGKDPALKAGGDSINVFDKRASSDRRSES